MITAAERKKIAKLVLTTEDNAIIEKIKALIFSATEPNEIFVKKYNKEIDDAIEKIRNGNYYTQEQADSLLASWEKK
jgi:hypothetical protein